MVVQQTSMRHVEYAISFGFLGPSRPLNIRLFVSYGGRHNW
jgi:hypothetical protein